MVQLQDVHGELTELGYQIIFVSPDRPEKLQGVMKDKKHDYTLLSDSKAEGAQGFGIAFRMDDETTEKYKKYGIDLEEASGETHHYLPVPGVFVFNKKGKVAFSYVDPNYRERIAPEVLLAAAKAARE